MLLITGGTLVRILAHRVDLMNLQAQITMALIDGRQAYEYQDEVGELFELEVVVVRGDNDHL